MAAIPFEIDTQSFRTKGEAEKFFVAMLNSYRPGDQVSGGDTLHLGAFLKRHPEARDKFGCGISHFFVRIADGYTTQCFHFFRTDGSEGRFSIRDIIYPPKQPGD